jgi:acetyl esterase/lipase
MGYRWHHRLQNLVPSRLRHNFRHRWRSLQGKRRIAQGLALLLLGSVPPLLSGVGAFLSMWIWVPAPTMALLPLGVGAPEVSPWLVGLNAIALVLNGLGLNRLSHGGSGISGITHGIYGTVHKGAISLSLLALLLSLVPLAQFPSAHRQAQRTLETSLGPDWANVSPTLQTQLRPAPFRLRDSVFGIPIGPHRHTLGIPFATPDGVSLTLNLYQPPATASPTASPAGPYPGLIVIYGGGWQNGSPSNDESFSRYMAAQGYVVVAIDYRHAPQYQFPAQLEDVNTAIAFIQAHAQDYEIDRDRLVILGRSAGAHLAMLAAYRPNAPKFRAVINYYGPVDLAKGYADPPQPDPINTRALLTAFLGGTPAQLADRYRQASPYTYATQAVPPTLLVYARRDHLVEAKFGRALGDRLRQSGNIAPYLEIPWAEHAFDAVFNGVSNQLVLYHVERFLAWATR